MKLICKETVYSDFKDILFIKDNIYDFEQINNRYSKLNCYIGYFKKDDEGFKRWNSRQFKEEYFKEDING